MIYLSESSNEMDIVGLKPECILQFSFGWFC